MCRSLVGVALLIFPLSEKLSAQDAQPSASVRFEIDNDLFALRGSGPPPDYDYTHGVRISILPISGPMWIARTLGAAPRCVDVAVMKQGCLLSGVVLGQEIYTPRHNVSDPVPGDRPHAAWLYGAVKLELLAGTRLQALEFRAGVTGPPALGEQVQNGVHRLLHNHLEAGWNHQVPTHLGATADYDATDILTGRSSRTASRFVAGSIGGTLGTLRRAVRTGAAAYYGFGAARSWSADAPLVERPGRFYVVAGYQQSLVLYDVFVEGIGSTPRARRIQWVGELTQEWDGGSVDSLRSTGTSRGVASTALSLVATPTA